VSVLSEPDTVARCMQAGATAYLVKPVERNSLTSTVRAQLASRSQPTA
jgi:DNA-binding NarL/FixJ family response regulator